ncbi:hypothetical protein [Desulfonema magnum]|uniref:Uncharacterized protein n=1 Tax=Desulfonema magnum TaxID=45655 RepID=A0A975BUJ9_9BACT|nr:hypothetical protein [Desulfonema magnum]QTA92031.1 Uncharacterized protein dnm_081050 [Desulfonema magnum]
MNDKAKIENTKKITISAEAGKTPDSADLTPWPFQFEFIFGLGTEGLTPFEYELADKAEGDEILLHLKQENLHETFEHICVPFHHLSDHPDAFYLKAQVVKVAPATDREIVKAMAGGSSCGDHCCGDGCCHL